MYKQLVRHTLYTHTQNSNIHFQISIFGFICGRIRVKLNQNTKHVHYYYIVSKIVSICLLFPIVVTSVYLLLFFMISIITTPPPSHTAISLYIRFIYQPSQFYSILLFQRSDRPKILLLYSIGTYEYVVVYCVYVKKNICSITPRKKGDSLPILINIKLES